MSIGYTIVHKAYCQDGGCELALGSLYHASREKLSDDLKNILTNKWKRHRKVILA